MQHGTRKPRPPGSTRRACRGGGFTLIELLLSLGVLTIGLAMVAAVFPAALFETEESVRNADTVLITHNAASLIAVKLTHELWWDSNGDGLVKKTDDAKIDTEVVDCTSGNFTTGGADKYPYGGDTANRRGFKVLARRFGGNVGENRYEFFIVAYTCLFENDTSDPDAGAKMEAITADVTKHGADDRVMELRGDQVPVDIFKNMKFKRGSPVIVGNGGNTGKRVWIRAVEIHDENDNGDYDNGDDYILITLRAGETVPEGAAQKLWIMYETNTNGALVGQRSPATGMLVTRRGLPEE